MMNSPITYTDPLFRPPSEANSLIFQVTNGCSWNKCTYCNMYSQPQKRFSVKPEAEVMREIEWAGSHLIGVRRVFLADGDAMALSTRRLLNILQAIREHLPDVTRVSSYCLPSNLNNKSAEDLKALHEAGLKLVYVGAESGDDQVLAAVNKGETYETTVEQLNRLADAGIKRSVMLINGLGGAEFSEQHALNSARLANATQPEYLATLVINFPLGEDQVQQGFDGRFVKLDQQGLFVELQQLLGALELDTTIFRSDHASNQLVLKGTLGKDKARLLEQVGLAIHQPQAANLRPEWIRSL